MKLTPEEAVKALEFLGVDAENLDGFKTKFAEGYIHVNRVEDYVRNEPEGKIKRAIIGNVVGEFEDSVKSVAKRFEIDLNSDDFKDMPKLAKKLDKIGETLYSKISEERETFKKGVPDVEKVNKEWETKYSKLQKDKEGIEGLLNTTKTEFEGFKTEVVTREKNSKLKDYWDKSFGSIKFSKEADDLKKEGFASKVKSKYGTDIDDKGKEFAFDLATGKKVPSKKNAGDFAGLDELIELEAINYKGLLDMSPAQQQAPAKPPMFGGMDNNQQQDQKQNNKPERKPSDMARKLMDQGKV